MGSKKIVIIMVVTLTVMIMCGPTTADITCGQVVNSLTPCISYVQNGGGAPAPECCAGVKSLFAAAKTTPDRQSICKCLKSALNGIPYSGSNAGLAAGLPSKCGLNIPYKIDPTVDCDSVK